MTNESIRAEALEEAAQACTSTLLMNTDSYCGATAHSCAERIRALKGSAPAQPVQDERSRDQRQLAGWLLTDPATGAPLKFAGPPENTGAWTCVRMQNSSGDGWTLTARLSEGWLTAEQRAALQSPASGQAAVPSNRKILDLAIYDGMTAKDGVYSGSAASILRFAGDVARFAAPSQEGMGEPVANVHTDDDAVDHFAAAMKEKLALARAKGRSGWHECDPADLSAMLREHVEKGDPRDVANFCMFLWSLGQPITAAPVAQPAASAEPVAWANQGALDALRMHREQHNFPAGAMVMAVPVSNNTIPLCVAPVAAQAMPDEVRDSLAESQYLAGVTAGWNAAQADDPNAALNAIHESRAGYLQPLREWQKSRRPAAQAQQDAELLDALAQAEAGLVFAGAEQMQPTGDFVPTPLLALRIVREALAGQAPSQAVLADREGRQQLLKDLGKIIHDMVVAQQAAWIEWQHGQGAEAAMQWIGNGLEGPGHIPDEEAPYGKEPQAWFDANCSNPLPQCFCGRPSNILWMGQGFCSPLHHQQRKQEADAQRAKEE